MQPEPSEITQKSPLDNDSHKPTHELQHGLRHSDEQSLVSSLPGHGSGSPTTPPGAVGGSLDSPPRAESGHDTDIGRLNSATVDENRTPTSPIEEYERAHSSSPPKSEYGFTIVKGSRRPESSISIEVFPNEVLTHILSHLPPPTLAATSLVSQRFHNLVTTPHAWRIAFSRFFPGPETIEEASTYGGHGQDTPETLRSDKRFFARLSALASWRSEYILRTRLLRSLARGRPLPFQPSTRSGGSRSGNTSQNTAVVTYGSSLVYPVSHMHATFGVGLNKKQPLFMHGACEQGLVTVSDPSVGKVGNWGLADNQSFKHFADIFPGDAAWGLGIGDIVGMPNIMDVSQPYGKVYGEACPGGTAFFTSTGEQRGRYLHSQSAPLPASGIPQVTMVESSVSSVWIAKSEGVLKISSGLIGLLAGYSNGVLSSYSLGANPLYDTRYEKGEVTATWVLSPGVPIVAICVDDHLSSHRYAQRRIWAVALNALGEVFYLSELPLRPGNVGKQTAEDAVKLGWKVGRSVSWNLVESTRREAKVHSFNAEAADGSYTPRSSSDAAGLGIEQIIAETKEIEKYLILKPKHFQQICEGWDMQRKLVVDFASDDRQGAGESILVVRPGLQEGTSASVRRFSRRRLPYSADNVDDEPYPPIRAPFQPSSLFGGPSRHLDELTSPSPESGPRSRTSSQQSDPSTAYRIEWQMSDLSFNGLRSVSISAVGADESTFAQLLPSEDPLFGMSGGSSASSPFSSPLASMPRPSNPSEIPGQRARFFAAGTTTGIVFVWNMRGPLSKAFDAINSLSPVRIIYTESPQISCLAMTSLYLVHGGNDGLVQAWDALASTMHPVRTLNSRFSSRARRRLVQAEASAHGVGDNYYAAGGICLDPDPTVLRGMVSLGTHLRYWSYSSAAADQYKSTKRRLRRSGRGSNSSPHEQRFSHTGRGALKDYIANEKFELEREKAARHKENELLSGRFGVDLLGPGASEEEMLAYARMLSEEAYTSDEMRRRGSKDTDAATSTSSGTIPANDSSLLIFDDSSASSPPLELDEDLDAEVAEAIRLSLQEDSQASTTHSLGTADIPIRYPKRMRSPSSSPLLLGSSSRSPATEQEEHDLEFALQLSLVEEQSRVADKEDDFPVLGTGPGSPDKGRVGLGSKDKGKRREI